MTSFSIEIKKDIPDHLYVEVDRRFDIAIERTAEGLSIRVYPRTDGELWCYPCATFEIDDAEVIALEAEMRNTS
jgi:hypothetical protein